MDYIEEAALKTEIAHILDSGANEERIFEMVKGFINNRPTITVADKLTMRDEFAKSAMQGVFSNNEMWTNMCMDRRNSTRDKEKDSQEDYVAQQCYIMADAMLKEREL
jgi:hypothetical protein